MIDHSTVLVIAEIGSVHDGSFGNAWKLIELAATSGADIAKFQIHIPEAESILNAPNPRHFQDEYRFEYFSRTSFSLNEWFRLKEHATACGIQFLASPFSIEAVDKLEQIDSSRLF